MGFETMRPEISVLVTAQQKPTVLHEQRWQEIAQRRRAEIWNAIPSSYIIQPHLLQHKILIGLPETCGLLNGRELKITSLTATSLLSSIHKGIYSAVEVAIAFCKRAAIAHQATNCLAWVMFDQAIADAQQLDDYFQSHGKPTGPLHGLPISVKEHIYFKGTPSTSGFIAWADDFATEDALIIKVLRDAGAVFHVKTTNPQSLMALETTSNLYGRTTNPHNINLTPGGSSGGESALIAMRGALLGIGTDIGGSIRGPCAFTGTYGLKPSVGRLPHGGLSGVHGGMENIVGCVGPMATSTEDLQLFCKVVLDAQPWREEPSLFPLSWQSSSGAPLATKKNRPLRIGFMMHDGIVHPHPPITRALTHLSHTLRNSGHELIAFSPSLHPEILACINSAYFFDGAEEYREVLSQSNEPPIPWLSTMMTKAGRKHWTARETWAVNKKRTKLQELYAKAWNEACEEGLDVLICPAHASVAAAHEEATYWGYTSAFNSLDLPGAVIPVGVVEEGDTWERWGGNGNGNEQREWMSEDDERYAGYYGNGVEGPRKYEGAPVAVQIVGRRLQEEKLMGVVEEIERCWTENQKMEELNVEKARL